MPSPGRYGPMTSARRDREATSAAETSKGLHQSRHDINAPPLETSSESPDSDDPDPITPPTVTVRCEFPAIHRSRQLQTLTCLVTIEVCNKMSKAESLGTGGEAHQSPSVNGRIDDDPASQSVIPAPSAPCFWPNEPVEVLKQIADDLQNRVGNWNGLDFASFGRLRLYGTLRVGKGKTSCQQLQCYLFTEVLIGVVEKKLPPETAAEWDHCSDRRKTGQCLLSGCIFIKHLNEVSETGINDENILTLALSEAELPQLHLHFKNHGQLELWLQALLDPHAGEEVPVHRPDYDRSDMLETHADIKTQHASLQGIPPIASFWGAIPAMTPPTESSKFAATSPQAVSPTYVPIDVVVVFPISLSMQGVKINLIRDALKFIVQNMGEKDRMGLATFGSGGGGRPLLGMTSKDWPGWANGLTWIKPTGQRSCRSSLVDGVNVAIDLLMQRKHDHPISAIMLISDTSAADAGSVDLVVSRAMAARISLHSFGLGMAHNPDSMVELSTRTNASYTYVKDWLMLRDCLAGCLGGMQSVSHLSVKAKLKIPEGSPAKFQTICGAVHVNKGATGRDVVINLGNLRLGERRDILVRLIITPDNSSNDQLTQGLCHDDVSGLKALSGSTDITTARGLSMEQVPLFQAALSWGDILQDGRTSQMPRASLLAILMLPAGASRGESLQTLPSIAPHPSIVQRYMELLTADVLVRALTLASRGKHESAHSLLIETRSSLKRLSQGRRPQVPPSANKSAHSALHPTSISLLTPTLTSDPKASLSLPTAGTCFGDCGFQTTRPGRTRSHGCVRLGSAHVPDALDSELERCLEWIKNPAVFGHDRRKAVLQAIGIISSQRAFTFRTPIERLWASRIGSIKRLAEKSRGWGEDCGSAASIMEED